MNEHSFKVLEFDKVCVFLESFAQSPGGRRLCRETKPCTREEGVQRLQQQTTEMRSEIEDSGPLDFTGAHDIKADVQRTRIENFNLDQHQLLRVADVLETTATAKSFFSGLQEKTPALFQLTEALIPCAKLVRRIRESISKRGDILDSASVQLAGLRAQLRSLRSNIIRSLEKYLHDVDLNFALQDDFITMRNNRFVIPVRSDRREAIHGVVHDQSQTKATFFIEPLEILELNNTLQLTQREIEHEEIRILDELSRFVQQHESEILCNLSILEELDSIHARARLSQALEARPAKSSDQKSISLKNCRHPILSARFLPADTEPESNSGDEALPGTWIFDKPGVVGIDIIKHSDISTQIISGANAGGKTVALKTLGLFVLMHQSGMHIPVAPEGFISHYDNLFADIGDEQNIESSMSTFSAHMERIKDVALSATTRSLVLLDELGSGTDPSEGGAIATAILDHLRSLQCTTIVTSHLNQLKAYAHTHDDTENVSVEFDPDTHRPLYRLVYGLPGFSNALSIARTIGIPESILAAAGKQVGQSDKHAAALINALEHSQQLLLEKQKNLDGLQKLNTALQKTSSRLLKTMQDRREHFLKKFEESGRALLRDSENTLRSLIQQQRRQLRNQTDSQTETHAMDQAQEIKQKIYRYFIPKSPPANRLTHVELGQRVRIVRLKKNGIVVSVDPETQRAEVDIGSMRVKAGFNELVKSDSHTKNLPKKNRPGATVRQGTGENIEKQVNVIGMRVAEALPMIDKTIDTAVLQGADTVEIIHGRGTGRLMRAIREHLRDHIQVARFTDDADDPGQNGITRIVIK